MSDPRLRPEPARLVQQLPQLLAFRAPYLEQKLVERQLVETARDAHELFQELKKYLVLTSCSGGRALPMFSLRVDEAWHQFVLFTEEYAAFCRAFAGEFLHHSPARTTPASASGSSGAFSREEFRDLYERWFGALPEAWSDEASLTPSTRLCRASWAGPFAVRLDAGRALLLGQGERNTLLCKVNVRARQALEFIARERLFLVRELPNLASHDERVALCRPLVEFNVLSLAP